MDIQEGEICPSVVIPVADNLNPPEKKGHKRRRTWSSITGHEEKRVHFLPDDCAAVNFGFDEEQSIAFKRIEPAPQFDDTSSLHSSNSSSYDLRSSCLDLSSLIARPQVTSSQKKWWQSGFFTEHSTSSSNRPSFTTHRSWIERVFQKRECTTFIPLTKDPHRCGCGLTLFEHLYLDPKNESIEDDYWISSKHTEAFPTDSYGMIEFQGGPHPSKAQYVRIAYDTQVDQILHLLTKEWQLELPKLLISVHGGKVNFELQPKLKKVLRKGLLKAAKTTGAWIFTAGTNTGVMKHVGEALVQERSPRLRNRVISIGIVPWGIIENRQDLIGKDSIVQYHSISTPKSRFCVLNNHHSYFILVDNGTVGRYGAEIAIRKKLEKHISLQRIFPQQQTTDRKSMANGTTGVRFPQTETRSNGVPVVCVVIEGGTNTIRGVLEYVTDTPPVPVVVCDGSGRAADLLAFAHKYLREDGSLPDTLRDQLLATIKKTFECPHEVAQQLQHELLECVRRKDLITVFRMGEEPCQELDQAILAALLKGSRLSAPEQLSLSLTWNRVDIARTEIFVYGQEWPSGSLEQAMMDALIYDRMDFVKLLLENGVSMKKFLTIPRLEELYNLNMGPSSTLRYLLRDVRKNVPIGYRYTLYDIGLVVERLMGGAYRSSYCRRHFRNLYNNAMGKTPSLHRRSIFQAPMVTMADLDNLMFKFPFNELLVWAVLMKRQQMALFMWQNGEEALARALVACRLYKAMASEASQDDLEADVSEELRKNAREFEDLSLQLLDYCYREDDDLSQQLLTYELQNWSKQTCLSLAVAANHRAFLAHTCCQFLLADLWMGGLRMRRNTNIKVILGLLCPPFILTLEFKSKEELQHQPQTEEEYRNIMDLHDLYFSSENASRTQSHETHDEPSHDLNSGHPRVEVMAKVENGKLIHDSLVDSDGNFRGKRKKPLQLGRRIYEFYAAPVTKFWGQTIAYTVFLCCFTYVVLVKLDQTPSAMECYVVAYIFTLGLEKVRQFIISEPVTFVQKLVVWTEKKWNPCDVVLILFFLVGLALRLYPPTLRVGRVIYCVDIMYWYIRILDILSVNKYLGPFVTMIGKMVLTMIYFVVLLAVVLMAFGVARQAILHPDEEPSWQLARNIFFNPYWMIYGEVFADDIDPPCGEPPLIPCRTGRWIAPVAMAVYLLIANILLINLLIAIFNHIFQEVNAISQQIWKFQRFYVVMEYEQMPVLPPPLIILNHLYLIIKFCCRKLGGRKLTYDHSLKLFLYGEGLQSIYDYEEECVDGYFQEIDTKVRMSADDQVKCTNERVESMSQKVDDVYHRENLATMTLQMLDLRLTHLEEVTEQTASSLTTIQRILELWEAQQLPASMTESMISDQEMPPSPANPSPSDQPTEKQTETEIPLETSNQPNLPPLELSPVQPEPSPVKSSLHQKRIMRRRLQRSMRQSSCDEDPPTGSETHRPTPKIAVLRSLSVTRSEPDYPQSTHSSPKFERSYSVAPPGGSHDHPIHVIPATPRPLLSATRNVYTSITDELEGLLTPATTPSLKRLGSSSSDTTEQALQAEAHMLHSAELADYQMMEGLIQRRLHRNSENLTTSLEDLCSVGYDSEQNDDAPPIPKSPSPGLSFPSLSSTSQQQSQPLKSPQRPLKSSLKKPSVRAETQC